MAEMTGGQALVQSLKREGVDVIFALPGVQLDWAFDALHEERDSIRVIHTRHEQATSYMADGYARSTGKIGVCMMVPGPGLLNAGAGLSTAYSASSPVLAICGQIASDLIGKERGALHEIKNQLEMVGSVTKWAARPMSASDVPGAVREAFVQLTSGRPRPVEVEIPPDVLMKGQDVLLSEPGIEPRLSGDPDLLERAAQALGQAKTPAIFAGGGVVSADAGRELLELAEMLEAPVVLSPTSKGAISSRHHLSHTGIASYELLPKADVILAIGTRFVGRGSTVRKLEAGQTLIHLDIDPEEIGRNLEPQISIVSDAKAGLAELLKRTPRHNHSRASRVDEMAEVKAKVGETLTSLDPLGSYADAIRAELPDDGIFVSEVTQVGHYSAEGFPVYEPRTFITPGYQGTLGFGFPTSLGVKVGNPDKAVVSIAGDGGFMFGVQELATMVQFGINSVVVVFNDSAFGNVRRTQANAFDGHILGSDLRNPDFLKLADSFGVTAHKAEGPDALRAALRRALDSDAPALIDVPMKAMPNPFAAFAPPQPA